MVQAAGLDWDGWTERNELVGIRKGSGCGLRDALGNWRNPR